MSSVTLQQAETAECISVTGIGLCPQWVIRDRLEPAASPALSAMPRKRKLRDQGPDHDLIIWVGHTHRLYFWAPRGPFLTRPNIRRGRSQAGPGFTAPHRHRHYPAAPGRRSL